MCGENSHAAILCPSFYKAEVVQNAGTWERLLHRLRGGVIGLMAGKARTPLHAVQAVAA